MKRAFFRTIFAILPVLGALVSPTPASLAADCGTSWYCWPHWQGFDGSTRCAWRRTWHGPNALATPLTGYYIPRAPSCCEFDGCAVGCGCAVGQSFAASDCVRYEYRGDSTSSVNPPEAGVGVVAPQFERLGQIANDLDVAGAMGTPGATGRGQAPSH